MRIAYARTHARTEIDRNVHAPTVDPRKPPMPFTPFHLGPGLACKALLGPRFSFMVFGGAQVLMDIEPLIGILRGWPVLHGPTHTLAGALLIGSIAGVIGRPVSAFVLDMLPVRHTLFSWRASFAGAYVGTFSHVLLDAVMHADMAPWWPIVGGNALLGSVALDRLHVACVGAGVLGALGVTIRAMRARATP